MPTYVGFWKRVLDVVIALIALLVLTPVMLLVALMIRITDPGPVLFRQTRVGRNGVPYTMLKFRSMPVDTGDRPSDQVGSVELTWLGRLIRRTNIDELPQLLNIVAGDMSIVGPRPPLRAQDDLVAQRHANGAIELRPGLTGLAQVNAFDGMTVDDKARLDGEYARAVSLRTDLIIIVRTFGYLTKRPPVY